MAVPAYLKEGQKNAVGRPLKYKSNASLKKGVKKYFEECDKNGKPYTMSGLAFSLGIDRDTLINYSNREEFFGTVNEAKQRVQIWWEEKLAREKGQVAGIIFNLKNNHGWKDKSESEVINTHLHLHGVAKASYQDADRLEREHITSLPSNQQVIHEQSNSNQNEQALPERSAVHNDAENDAETRVQATEKLSQAIEASRDATASTQS